MSAFTLFGASVSRISLGLPDLDLNDHISYQVADKIFGSQQAWNRQTVKSPYVDGEFLVNATKGNVTDTFSVQVMGPSQSYMQAAINAAVDAFSQFSYLLTVIQDDASVTYTCMPADYTIDWSKERMWARQGLVTFQFPRLPQRLG